MGVDGRPFTILNYKGPCLRERWSLGCRAGSVVLDEVVMVGLTQKAQTQDLQKFAIYVSCTSMALRDNFRFSFGFHLESRERFRIE